MIAIVMHGKIEYRQIVLKKRDDERLRLPLLAPLNDALVDRAAQGYATYLSDRYGALGWPHDWQTFDRAAFRAAAASAVRGHVDAAIARHLERLRFDAEGTVRDVPDLAALAAWSLLEAVRREELKLRVCPTCKQPWLAASDERSRYCQRRVNGTGRDCRTLDRERRLAGSGYGAYRREYNRLTEKQRRGTLTVEDLLAWRAANSAPDWKPFERWNERRSG